MTEPTLQPGRDNSPDEIIEQYDVLHVPPERDPSGPGGACGAGTVVSANAAPETVLVILDILLDNAVAHGSGRMMVLMLPKNRTT